MDCEEIWAVKHEFSFYSRLLQMVVFSFARRNMLD